MVFISRELLNFITVARVKTLEKASKELFITKSPISRSLKKLEHSLGLKLFVRKGQGLILTEDGIELYNKIIIHFNRLYELESSYRLRKLLHQ
jgi:DNA-binding transcriptional LysR family regulator